MTWQDEQNGPEDVLDELARLGDRQAEVSIGDVQKAIGRRSFGPFLLVPALIDISPIGAIPGLPTALAVIVVLFAAQLLLNRKHFWLPAVLRKREIDARKLNGALERVRPVAQWSENIVRARLTWATHEPFVHIIAALCIALACIVPPLEVVPFATTAPFGAIGLFGLALIARDGLLVLIGLAVSAAALYVAYAALV